MSDEYAGKVLVPCKNLIGKQREAGELLTQEEIDTLKPHIVKALERGGKIEVFSKTSKVAERFETRMKFLEKKVEDILEILEGGSEKPPAPRKGGRPRGSKNKPKE